MFEGVGDVLGFLPRPDQCVRRKLFRVPCGIVMKLAFAEQFSCRCEPIAQFEKESFVLPASSQLLLFALLRRVIRLLPAIHGQIPF